MERVHTLFHASPSFGRERVRVVLAEDDDEMRRLLSRAVSLDGYEVVVAGTGHALLRQLREYHVSGERPALIVSDVRMPGCTGLDVLRAIRAWDWSVPMVLITAFGDEGLMSEAVREGATCMLNKPFEVDDLRLMIRHMAPPGSGSRPRGRGDEADD